MTDTAQTIDVDGLTARMKAVIDYVSDCQRRVSLGEIMDLSGLDQNVMALCEVIAAMPKKDAMQFESRMKTLIDSLEELARLMQDQQKKFAGA